MPADEGRMMKLFVPSSETGAALDIQLVVLKSALCCKVQPRDALFQNGQETLGALPVGVMHNCGVGVARNP